MGQMFLVLVDATSKWVEVCIMSSITSESTIEKLKVIFATHGLPRIIVTDNGPSFTSGEFADFCKANGIKHVFAAPYHPATNGLAERAVQSFKKGLEKTQGGTLQSRLSRYLFHYRLTPHSVTGIAPAEALMSRRLRSPLDLVYPEVTGHPRRNPTERGVAIPRSFEIGQQVYVRDFRSRKPGWVPGTIKQVTGPVSYQIEVEDRIIRRHVDHVRSCHERAPTEDARNTRVTGDSMDLDFMDTPEVEVQTARPVSSSDTRRSSNSDSSPIEALGPRRSSRARNPVEHYPGLVYY